MERLKKFRCYLCYRYELTLKTLIGHYLRYHSKIQIVEYLLKQPRLDFLIKKRQKRKQEQLKKITSKILYFQNEILITCDDKSVILTDSSDNNNNSCTIDRNNVSQWLHLTIEESPNSPQETVEFVPETNQESSNQTCECTCKQKTVETKDNGIDNGDKKTPPTIVANKLEPFCTYYCNFCAAKDLSAIELIKHECMHQFYCDLCNCYYSWRLYQDHFKQHIFRIYICHWCSLEFYSKDVLKQHLDHHLDQQVIIDILNMESDYTNLANFQRNDSRVETTARSVSSSLSLSPLSSTSSSSMPTNPINDDKTEAINNIVQYLMYTGDQQYSRNYLPM